MRRRSGVIAEQHPGLIGERADDGDLLDSWLEGQRAIVLEQHHGLIRKLAGQRAVFGLSSSFSSIFV